MLYFERIEVMNVLARSAVIETVRNYTLEYDKPIIYDKVAHEVNQFCSRHSLAEVYISKFSDMDDLLLEVLQAGARQWAPGVEIVGVRISKPRIPAEIEQHYQAMEAEKTKLLVAEQRQKVSMAEAETAAKVSAIHMQQLTAEREAERARARIADEQ